MDKKFCLPRIRTLREKNKWSKNELAAMIGISPSAMGNYESGERIPDARVIIKLAQAFDVSTDYLLGLSMLKEADVQAISNAIGLWEAAIHVLFDNKQYIDFLNKLIINDKFPRLLEEASKYIVNYEAGAYDGTLTRLISEQEDEFTRQKLTALLALVRNSDIQQYGSEPVISIFKKILEDTIHTFYFTFPCDDKYIADEILEALKEPIK